MASAGDRGRICDGVKKKLINCPIEETKRKNQSVPLFFCVRRSQLNFYQETKPFILQSLWSAPTKRHVRPGRAYVVVSHERHLMSQITKSNETEFVSRKGFLASFFCFVATFQMFIRFIRLSAFYWFHLTRPIGFGIFQFGSMCIKRHCHRNRRHHQPDRAAAGHCHHTLSSCNEIAGLCVRNARVFLCGRSRRHYTCDSHY